MSVAHGEVWGVTPDCWSTAETIRAVVTALQEGVDRVIVRERRLAPTQRHTIVASVLATGLSEQRVLLRVGSHDHHHPTAGRFTSPTVSPCHLARDPFLPRPSTDSMSFAMMSKLS